MEEDGPTYPKKNKNKNLETSLLAHSSVDTYAYLNTTAPQFTIKTIDYKLLNGIGVTRFSQ